MFVRLLSASGFFLEMKERRWWCRFSLEIDVLGSSFSTGMKWSGWSVSLLCLSLLLWVIPVFFSLSWFCFSVSSSCFSRLSSSVFFLPSQFSSFSICLYFFSLCPLVLFVPSVLLYCWSWQTVVEEGPLLLLAHGALQRRSFDGGITCGQGRTGSWCKGEDAWWWITPFRCHGLRLGYCSWKNTPLLLVDDLLLLLDYAG